jgi:transposase
MANRRQRRWLEKNRRARPVELQAAPRREPLPSAVVVRPAERVVRLTYTRRQAAEALGVSLSTVDRRVVPVLRTFLNDWGMRLIPVDELERYVAEHTRAARAELRPRRRGGRPRAVRPDVVARVREPHAAGRSLATIARELNADEVPTAQGGRHWWPSTVRSVLERTRTD